MGWDYWQSSLLLDQAPEQLKLAFRKGHKIIDTGLDLVMQRLEKMLSLQAKGGKSATSRDLERSGKGAGNDKMRSVVNCVICYLAKDMSLGKLNHLRITAN
jgi:hypothetical protein